MSFIRNFFICCFLLISFCGISQLKYSNFNANVVNKKVLLSWTVEAGDQCQGIYVQWSLDGETFEDVGDIQGVCGDPFNDSDYDFLHTTPTLNTINYYRLRFGTSPYSKVISIEVIDVDQNEYIIRPNPVLSSSELIFSNPGNEEVQLEIKDSMGKTVLKKETNLDRFYLSNSELPIGTYYFEISSSRIAIRGKFIIL